MSAIKNKKPDQILPDKMQKKFGIVSSILADAELAPGFYLRTLDGEIIPVTFSGADIPEKIHERYNVTLPLPPVDFVYDMGVEAVFAGEGQSYQLWADSHQDRSGIDEDYYLYSGDSEFRIVSGHVNLEGGGDSDRKHRTVTGITVRTQDEMTQDVYFLLASLSLGAQALSAGVSNLFRAQLLQAALDALDSGELSASKNSWAGITIPEKTPLSIGKMDVLTIAYSGENGNIYAAVNPNGSSS